MKKAKRSFPVSRTELDALIKYFEPFLKLDVHIYHFYDTDDFIMSKDGIASFIIEDGTRMTAYEEPLSHKETDKCKGFSISVPKVSDIFPFGEKILKIQGHMLVERHGCRLPIGVSVNMDKSTFLGKTDWEVEIEYPIGKEYLADIEIMELANFLLRNHFVTDVENLADRVSDGKSKSERFFERLGVRYA